MWIKKIKDLIKNPKEPTSPFKEFDRSISLSQDITLIDIGAHRGSFTKYVASKYKIKTGILVEPIPECYLELKEKFKSDNFFVLNYALGEKNEIVDFFINDFKETSSLLKIKDDLAELNDVNTTIGSTIKIQSKTLDSVLEDLGIQEIIDLIKLDVQGAEHFVLNGSIKTLKITKYIFTEVSFYKLYEGSSDFWDIYEFLQQQGFKMVEIEPAHRSPLNEILQANIIFKNFNNI